MSETAKPDLVKIYSLVEKKVNVHGELHLDSEFTKILINWLRKIEDCHDEQVKMLPELEEVAAIFKKFEVVQNVK